MDGQELYNLHEAYMDVYEGKVEWDNPKRSLKSGWTPREKNRAKRISLGIEDPNERMDDKKLERYGKLKLAHDTQSNIKPLRKKQSHQFKNKSPYARLDILDDDIRQMSHPQKTKLQKIYNKKGPRGLREPKESYDYYDIILSHLLDEGYAETPEAAEAMMVNMSEDWRDSIIG